MALALAVATLVVAPAHHDCNTQSCVERVAARWCTQTRVVSCIHRAALRWDVSYPMLRRKAWCESRLDPYATNGTHVGVFQFLWSTWATTPYAHRSPWRAKWNALAAAWMHARGRGNEWSCQ